MSEKPKNQIAYIDNSHLRHKRRSLVSTPFFILSILFSIFMLCNHAMAEGNSVPGTLYQFSNPPGYGAVQDNNIKSNVYNAPSGRPTSDLPSSVDLSDDIWFPKIRTQIGGSCVAWSTTYYQFTYQAARLNNWNAKTDDNKVFSPKYVWNYLNGGKDTGVSAASCYNILSRQGCLRWSEFPQTSLSFEWFEGNNDSQTIASLQNALKTRVSYSANAEFAVTQTNSTNSPVITSYNDPKLTQMKELLNSGHPLTIYTYINSFYVDTLANGEKICLYMRGNNGYHAMTIVGYDDNISFDLNQNGTTEDYEKGAFLVANSWGKNYGNDGFIWILYDALNKVSNVKNLQFENRQPILENNRYYYIEVSNYTPERMVEVILTQKYRNDITIALATSDDLTSEKERQTTFLNGIGGEKNFDGTNNSSYQTRTFVFDYADLSQSDDKVYWVEVTDKQSNSAVTTVQKIRWVDGNGNVLKTINQQPSLDGQTGSYCYGDDYSGTYNQAYGVALHTKTSGIIDRRGDVDFFKFTPSASGVYLIYTTGSTDTMGYLYNASQTVLVENDDASLSGNNFAFKYNLEANKTYYIKVTGYSTKTGSYTLNISKDFYRASLASYNQDARRVQMQAEAAAALTSLKLKIGNNTYPLTKPSSGNLDTTINGARFKVTFQETNNGLSTIWIIEAKIPATKSGATDTVSFDFSKGKITDVKSPDLTGLVAYDSAIKTGVDVNAANSLQKLRDTMKQEGYTLELYNWNDSLINVTSTTKAASGMKIVEREGTNGPIRKIYYVVIFGDVTGDGNINIGDGKISSLDASAVLKHEVAISQLGALAQIAADVDHDGRITSNDALLINKSDVGLVEIDQSYTITTVPDECHFLTPVAF